MILRELESSPHGFPLAAFDEMLRASNLQLSREGNSLVAQTGPLITTVTVLGPPPRQSPLPKINYVVIAKTPIDIRLREFLSKPGTVAAINALATLGAMTEDYGGLLYWCKGDFLRGCRFAALCHSISS